ncbi:MAG: hypothetical protein JOZ90_11345 [Alphaproteobacteria bacterium]|nr:hypothetical protein [Alphaproteobacteria bacterium]MBV9372689.1 hypothetical protein [Alphaproteobacteria bacterium]MBV9901680.1 hypothetical protein [Alphaproteobacteria bacterium]
MHRFLLLVAALLLGGAAPSPRPVALRPGERVTLLIDDGGRSSEAARGEAGELGPFERSAAAAFMGGAYDYAVGPTAALIGEGLPTPKAVEPGAVRVRLVSLPRGYTMLILENGYRGALRYRAKLKAGAHSGPTDVCQVMPLKYGFETWPYPISRIELSDLKIEAWSEGQPPVCE